MMRVLFADPDKTLLALVRRTLEAEGHRVRVASTPEAVEVATVDGKLDVAFLDAQLATMAPEACARLQRPEVRVFVTTALSDGADSIRALRERFGGAEYLRKPFAVLDLPLVLLADDEAPASPQRGLRGGDLLGRMVARGASGPQRGWRPPAERSNRSLMPRMGGPVVFQVAQRLAGAWAERFTGQVRVRGTDPAIGHPLRLAGGGLVDLRDTSIVDVAVRGAQLEFVSDGDGSGVEGDRQTFIQMLWAAVYEPAEVRFAEVHAFEALEIGQEDLLPDILNLVGTDTHRVLADGDGTRALGEVVVQNNTTPATVSSDLQALHHLGLIRFTPPAARRVERRLESRAEGLGGEKTRGEKARVRKRSDEAGRRSAGTKTAPRALSRGQRSQSSSGSRRSGRAHVAEHLRKSSRVDGMHKRLELEVNRLKGVTPAEVLGVPKDAPGSLVRDIGGRMRSRYTAIAESEDYPESTRALARTLVEQVDVAMSSWGRSNIRAGGDPTTDREAVMLEQGMVLIDANEFARADR
ncbi:MAG TPA: hypothetical protein DFR83_18745, partial [Deltaproteobacteria bacterium]|nr:hypothetical protein [Deltaproteobacteria bacterium]